VNTVIIDEALEVPIVREQRDRFYQIFWHNILYHFDWVFTISENLLSVNFKPIRFFGRDA